MNNRRFWNILALAWGLLLIASCGAKQANQVASPPPAVAITAMVVSEAPAVYFEEYPGTVSALEEVELRPQVSGFITAIHFRDGDRVRKGQRLYSIDQQQFEANYQQAVANLQVQEANLARAQKDADRYHELDKHDAIAKQQVDYADATLEAARKQVDAARANVRSVQTAVRYSTITAPFDGTIGISQVKIGAPVTAGQTILNTISNPDPLAVDFNVEQKEIIRFGQLQQSGKTGDSTFTIAFDGQVYEGLGRIGVIDRAVDPRTSTVRVRLVFPNSKNLLKPGMTTTVRVRNDDSRNAILIPYKAVTEQLGEFFVYVINDSSKVNQRKVVLGTPIGRNIIIREGLTAGERIAIEGVQNLREGSTVTTKAPAPATTAQQKK